MSCSQKYKFKGLAKNWQLQKQLVTFHQEIRNLKNLIQSNTKQVNNCANK